MANTALVLLLLCMCSMATSSTQQHHLRSSAQQQQQQQPQPAGRRLWGPAMAGVLAEVRRAKPGRRKWDAKGDKRDDDKKLAKPTTKGGDFFFKKFFVPRHGFRTPVGEQATCVVDKVAHLLSLAFCGDGVVSLGKAKQRRSNKEGDKHHRHEAKDLGPLGMGCDSELFETLGQALGRCCAGEGKHIPAEWGHHANAMRRCREWVQPLASYVHHDVAPAFAACQAALRAIKAEGGKQGRVSAAQRAACDTFGAQAESLYAGANDMIGVARALYKTAHNLDLTKRTRKFLKKCHGNAHHYQGHAEVTEWGKHCKETLAKMWKAQTGRKAEEV